MDETVGGASGAPDAEADAARPEPWHATWRDEGRYLLELFVLCGFAVAQPTLDVLGQSPETFIFHGMGRWAIVGFTVLAVVVPPLVVWLPGALVGRVVGSGIRRWIQVGTLGLVALPLAIDVLRSVTPWLHVTLLVVAVVAAAALAAAYARWAVVRQYLVYASFAPVLFGLLFLFGSHVAVLVKPGSPIHLHEPIDSNAPVVFLLFDEFQTGGLLDADGNLDAARFPGFAELAGASTWYRNYTTEIGATTRALPTILTGSVPPDNKVPISTEYPDNLFTWLAPSHELHVSELVTQLCPASLCDSPGSRRGIEGAIRDARAVWWDVVQPHEPGAADTAQFVEQRLAFDSDHAAGARRAGPRNQPARFASWTDSFATAQEPSLFFLHLTLPHWPWRYYPSGQVYAREPHAPPGKPLRTWVDGPGAVTLNRLRFTLQTQYCDQLVAHTIDRLRAAGLWDDALVVVMADHGVSFTPEQDWRELSDANHTEIMWAPLFMKAPGQRTGAVDDVNMQAADVLPTVADLLGATLPWSTDGVSVLGPDRPTGHTKQYFRSDEISEDHDAATERVTYDDRGVIADLAARVPPHDDDPDDPLAVYRVGPHPDWIGRRLDALGATIERRGTVADVVGGLGPYRAVDLERGDLPALVQGTLELDESERSIFGRTVLVSLNGRVASVLASWNDFAGESFGALIPEALFQPGKNVLRAFEVVQPEQGPVTLRELDLR